MTTDLPFFQARLFFGGTKWAWQHSVAMLPFSYISFACPFEKDMLVSSLHFVQSFLPLEKKPRLQLSLFFLPPSQQLYPKRSNSSLTSLRKAEKTVEKGAVLQIIRINSVSTPGLQKGHCAILISLFLEANETRGGKSRRIAAV